MARVKRGVTSHAKHKKVYKLAKGFRGRRKNTIRTAKAAVDKAAQYAFRDLILQRIDGRALGLPFVRRKLAERGEQRGNRSLLAERSDARPLERAFIRRAFNRGQRLPFKGGKVRHSSRTPGEAYRSSLPVDGKDTGLA